MIDAEAPADGFLLLADTFYPGWTATVDGAPAAIYRANHSVRGIQLPRAPRGPVRLRGAWLARGLQITLLSAVAAAALAGGAAYVDRRGRARQRQRGQQ